MCPIAANDKENVDTAGITGIEDLIGVETAARRTESGAALIMDIRDAVR